jgi:general secretion pathway protein K
MMSDKNCVVLSVSCLPRQGRGSALLAALLTVALVAAFASRAYWQEWRSIEVETAERSRLQAGWLLGGTHDWARARLRDDALNGGAADHLAEAWAQPVVNMPLNAFGAGDVAMDDRSSTAVNLMAELDTGAHAAPFVSQQLSDAQGKINLLNLLENQALSPVWLQAFDKLFEVLKLPPEQLVSLSNQLRQASVGQGGGAAAPILPQQMSQLVWLGLAPATLDALQPHVTLLPSRTPVNLNTASVEVLQSLLPSVKRVDAERVVALRQATPFQTVADAGISDLQSEGQYSVSSRFFELHTEIGLGPVSVAENALLQRDGINVRTLWRRRAVAAENLSRTTALTSQQSP